MRRLRRAFMSASTSNRLRALALYKELHRLGREYPDPRYVSLNLPRILRLRYVYGDVLIIVVALLRSLVTTSMDE